MIIGSNSFEASLMKAFPVATDQALARMTPRQRALYTKGVTDEIAVRDAYTDLVMGAPARWIAARSSTGAPTFLYHFSYVASGMRDRVPGASHGSEIIYVFKTGSKIAGRLASDQDRAMETLVHSCWVSFATTGKPACGPTAWPAYRPKEDQLMEFGVSSGLRKNFRKPYYDADDAALDDN